MAILIIKSVEKISHKLMLLTEYLFDSQENESVTN